MRALRFILVIFVILVALYVVVNARLWPLFRRPSTTALPVDLQQIIPAAWSVLPGKYQQCDFDNDGEPNWLVIYAYDATTLTVPSRTSPLVTRHSIGGVIYDAQVNLVPQDPGIQNPYRPSFLIPYRLLPDIYTGKGQGYLGESDVELYYAPPLPTAGACATSEIAIVGYSDSPVPTRLSLFRWGGDRVGYRGVHFAGNARLETEPAVSAGTPINEVRTYNRFNDRSRLCEMRVYRRSGPVETLDFTEDESRFSIAFCYDPPRDPAYPEAVVMAALRGAAPSIIGIDQTPTGNSYLQTEALESLPAQLDGLRTPGAGSYRILSIENPGSLPGYPTPSVVITDTLGQLWLWGQEQVVVTTTLVLDGRPRDVRWQLGSLANERIRSDMHWRIERVTLP